MKKIPNTKVASPSPSEDSKEMLTKSPERPPARDNATRRWNTGPTRPPIEPQPGPGEWRVWPWRDLGDKVAFALGLLILALPGPFMGVLIGTGELSMAILRFIWRLTPLPRIVPPLIKSFAETWGQKLLKDPRNGPFLPHMLWLSVWMPTLFLASMYYHSLHGFSWVFFFVYHFLRIGPRFRFFAHLHVLVHREGHENLGLFKAPYGFLNHWPMQWLVGPFYGQVPNSYGIAHNKIHHRYDNGLDDVHTNLDLDRTKFSSFVIYAPRFFLYWAGISPLIHFLLRKEWVFARKMFLGMLYHVALFYAISCYDLTFAVAFILYPFLESIVFFSGISYLWHCWVDPEDPYNPYVTSVTILKGHDNIWNEDYHVIHHDNLTLHWSLAPKHFEENRAEYARNKATVFEDTEEGAMLFWMLSGNWDMLAKHFVDLDGKLDHAQKKALLLRRASFVVRPQCQ